MGNCITSPPSRAAIVSGPLGTRVAIGRSVFQAWCIERTDYLQLDIRTIELRSTDAETTKGVRVNVNSIAQVRVNAFVENEESGDSRMVDKGSVLLAGQHFLGSSDADIDDALRKTLEGHQREILGTLTVEEIYKDRAAFSGKVKEHVQDDLFRMGFGLVSYTVVSVEDDNGYMIALGQTQTSLVQREAAEGTVKNESQARKKVAQLKADADEVEAIAQREAHVQVNVQKEKEADSDHLLELKRAEYDKKVLEARAVAEAAKNIEDAKQKQRIVREVTQQRYVEAEVELSIADAQVEKEQKVKEGESKARLLAETNNAEAVLVLAKAEAEKIRLLGQAHADAVRADGQAQADVLKERAQAFKQYDNSALVYTITDKLPEIAREISAPLAKTDKMIFLSGNDGGGPQMLTNNIANMMASLPVAVKGLTGFDMNQAMKDSVGQSGEEKKEELAMV